MENIKRLEEKKQKTIKEPKKEISLIKNNNNKSNTLKSSSIYSMTTSITRKPRIHSAYKTFRRKNILTYNDQQSNKTLKTYYDRTVTIDSKFSSPSKYLSLTDNYNNLYTKNGKIYSRDRIINEKKIV